MATRSPSLLLCTAPLLFFRRRRFVCLELPAMERGILRFQFRIFLLQQLQFFQRRVQSGGQHIDNAQMFLVLLTGTLILFKDPRCGQSIQMRTVVRVRTAKVIRRIRGTGHGAYSRSNVSISQFTLESFCRRSHSLLYRLVISIASLTIPFLT